MGKEKKKKNTLDLSSSQGLMDLRKEQSKKETEKKPNKYEKKKSTDSLLRRADSNEFLSPNSLGQEKEKEKIGLFSSISNSIGSRRLSLTRSITRNGSFRRRESEDTMEFSPPSLTYSFRKDSVESIGDSLKTLEEIIPQFNNQVVEYFGIVKQIRSERRAIDSAKNLLTKMYENNPESLKQTQEEIEILEKKKEELEKKKEKILESFPPDLKSQIIQKSNETEETQNSLFETTSQTKALEMTENYAQILILSKEITQETKAIKAAKLLLTMYVKDPSGYKQTESQIQKLNESLKGLYLKRAELIKKMPTNIKELFERDDISQNWAEHEIVSVNSDQSEGSKVFQHVKSILRNIDLKRKDTMTNLFDSGNSSNQTGGSWGRKDKKKTATFKSTTISIDNLYTYMKQLKGSGNHENNNNQKNVLISEPALPSLEQSSILFDKQGICISKKGVLEIKCSSLSQKKWEKHLVSLSDGQLTIHTNNGSKIIVLTDSEIKENPPDKDKSEFGSFTLTKLKHFKDIQFGNFSDDQDKELWLSIVKLHSDLSSVRSFGATLVAQSAKTQNGIPEFFEKALNYLSKPEVLSTEGIFRISSTQNYVMEWRKKIDSGDYNLEQEKDPHVVANLLKQYLRELPNPILTYQLYDLWNSLYEKDFPDEVLNSLLTSLPDPHQYILHHLLNFLHTAIQPQYSQSSKMTADNIAIIFGPTLLRNPRGENLSLATSLAHILIKKAPQVTKFLVPQPEKFISDSIDLIIKNESKKEEIKKEEKQDILNLQVASQNSSVLTDEENNSKENI